MARTDDFKRLKEEVHNMYNGRMDLVHQTKRDWKKDLENFHNETTDRRNEISQLRNQVSSLLANFNAQDKERASGIADLRAATQAFVADCTKGSKARAKDVANLDVANLLAGFSARDKERTKEVEDLKAETAKLIAGFKREREEAAAAWKDLLATMASVSKVAPKKEAVAAEEVVPGEPMPKPKRKKKKEKSPGVSDKETKILSVIKDNPDGMTLPQIAYVMGVAFVTITRDVKKLLADGLIKKEENQYFPV